MHLLRNVENFLPSYLSPWLLYNHTSPLYQDTRLHCKDKVLHTNRLVIRMLFPYLVVSESFVVEIILPDWTAEQVEEGIKYLLTDEGEGVEGKTENLESMSQDFKDFDEETILENERMKTEIAEEYLEVKIKSRNKHLGENKAKWTCHVCEKSFRFIRLMRKHFVNDHENLNCFKCKYCGFETKNNASLMKHENTHTKERVYLCEECDKRYHDRSDLIKHKASHAGSVQCDLCEKSVKSTFYLKRHMRKMHSITKGEESFVCDVCPSSFKLKEYLTRHVKKVHCEYSYLCAMCEKKFKTKYHLTQHELQHTGEFKTSACNLCGIILKGNGIKRRMNFHLESHSKKHPVTGYNIQCEYCEYYFRGQTNLVQHKLIHHSQ